MAGLALSPWLWTVAHAIPWQPLGAVYNTLSQLAEFGCPHRGHRWRSVVSRCQPWIRPGSVGRGIGLLGTPFLGAHGGGHRAPAQAIGQSLGGLDARACFRPGRGKPTAGRNVGRPTVTLGDLQSLPIVGVVLTGRFMLYAFMLAAGLVGWLSAGVARGKRWLTALMLLAAIIVLPNLSYQGTWSAGVTPPLLNQPKLLLRYVPVTQP